MYKINKIDNKGLGTIALKNIEPNTLIFSEKSNIIISKKSKKYEAIIIKFVYLLLNNKKIKNMFSLCCPHELDENCISEVKILNIIKNLTNLSTQQFLLNFNVSDLVLCYEKVKRNVFESDDKMFFVFNGTKFNHSCVPNIYYYFDHDTLTLSFYSNKKILSGEELVISYISENMSKSCLVSTYGFTCKCPKCQN